MGLVSSASVRRVLILTRFVRDAFDEQLRLDQRLSLLFGLSKARKLLVAGNRL